MVHCPTQMPSVADYWDPKTRFAPVADVMGQAEYENLTRIFRTYNQKDYVQQLRPDGTVS